jgi:cytochrome P450 family 135
VSAGSRSKLPPGPRLPAALQTVRFFRDPDGFLSRCRRRYGPVFRVSILAAPRLVYVTERGLAQRIFQTDRGIGRAGEVRRDFLGPLVGDHSLLCLDGDEWLRQRRLLGPAFHGPAVEGFRREIAEIAGREIDRWPVGEPMALHPRMQAITLDVILRLVFGIRDDERLRRLRELLPPLLDGGHWILIWALPSAARQWLERSRLVARLGGNPVARFRARREELDAILYAEIARRRRDGDAPEGRGGPPDALALMLAARDEGGRPLTDDELRDELVTLLTAGHETTATGLAWAFERLMRNPGSLARLREELAAGESAYLDAVAKEVLRSRPVVMDAPRLLDAPLELDGHEVPAGWLVAPAIPLVHEETAAFPEPEEFRPERFLNREVDLQAWIPFGGGLRRCLGSHLALLEMKTVISEVVQRVELEPVDPAPERRRVKHVTLVPSERARAVVRPAQGAGRSYDPAYAHSMPARSSPPPVERLTG